jgi:protein SCO1/2
MIRALVLIWLLAAPAWAGLSRAELDRVRVDLPPGAAWPQAPGRPAVLIFADFDCAQICDAILAQTAGMLAETGLEPGADYLLIVVGLDPQDGALRARDALRRQTPEALRPALRLLQPGAAALARMTAALGYGYLRDPESGQFAHPAARYVLAADGAVRAVLPAFDAAPQDLRRAILAAGQGAPALVARLILLCYGLDPATGRHAPAIRRLLMALAALVVLGLGAGIGRALWRERRAE